MRCWFLCTIFSASHKNFSRYLFALLAHKGLFLTKIHLVNTRFLSNYSFCLVLQYLSIRKEQRWILLLLARKQVLASSKWILIYISGKGAETQTQHCSSTISFWDGARCNGEMERIELGWRQNLLLFVCACFFLLQSDRSTRDFLTLFGKIFVK